MRSLTALEDPVLIGEALELAGIARADKPVDPGDARAVQVRIKHCLHLHERIFFWLDKHSTLHRMDNEHVRAR